MTLINAGAPRLQPVLKVGRTITDLACTEEIELAYNAEAIRYGSLNRRL
jgi:predicted ATPase with chaperone activity